MASPIFTRRAYVRLARMVALDFADHDESAREILADRLADVFASDNGRFRPSTWYAACEVLAPWERDVPEPQSLRAVTADEREQGERERIAERGYRDGRAAGSWVTDGNTRPETYRALLAGIEEGDSAILDTLPTRSLGGEWADEPTWSDVLAEEDCEDSDDGRPDLLDVYEEQFSQGVTDEVTRACRIMLAEEPDEGRRSA